MEIALLKLTHQYFCCHNQQVWFGMADFNHNKKRIEQKVGQSQAVRVLLKQLLTHYHIEAQLDEVKHPYRLDDNKWVSFSHSKQCVAVVVSDKPVGIDIEKNAVSFKIAERFFCQNECYYLTTVPEKKRNEFCKLLWQIKECLIKIEQISLFKGMKVNILDSLLSAMDKKDNQELLNCLNIGNFIEININQYGDYHLYQCPSKNMVSLRKEYK